MDHFDTHRTDPELTLALAAAPGGPDVHIDIAAAGGGQVGNTYTGTSWIYRLRVDRTTVASGDDIRANATGMTHHDAARLAAELLATHDHVAGGDAVRARLADFADDGHSNQVYPHLVTVHTRIFYPWREGEAEPDVKSETAEGFIVEDFQDDNGAWNHDDTEWIPASVIDTAVAMLRGAHTRFYATDASQTNPHFENGGNPWYVAEDYLDPYSGEREEHTAHLSGFSPDQLRAIHDHIA